MTTAVDGGELAWKLTQISAGKKVCHEKAIDALTGRLLFGESGLGYCNLQSRKLCFPLQVKIAKDNSEFYERCISTFFQSEQA